MHIFAYLQSGNTEYFKFKPSDIIQSVKNRIQEKLGFPADSLRIIFDERNLDNNLKFSDYNIQEDSSLYLYQDQPDGGCIQVGFNYVENFNNFNQTLIEWSKRTLIWRQASPGLSYENICNKNNCIAYGEQVVMNMGFGLFKFGIPNDKMQCPVCKTKLTNIPKTCAFNNCQWKYDGVKTENGDTKKLKSDWKHVGDEYYRFVESETSNWTELVLSVKEK